jgi:hypothetical protein
MSSIGINLHFHGLDNALIYLPRNQSNQHDVGVLDRTPFPFPSLFSSVLGSDDHWPFPRGTMAVNYSIWMDSPPESDRLLATGRPVSE